jgi:hypothetical protein
VLVALVLAGCGADEPEAARTVTVTGTPSTPPTSTTSAPVETGPTSDVADRAHDVGTITAVEEVDGTTVLTLDRWTYADWSEERVAEEGVPLEPLSDNPFRNQNDTSTYAVPVSPDAVVGVNSCEVGTDGTPRIATTAGGVDDLVAGTTIWLLTYTEGVLTKADSAAAC